MLVGVEFDGRGILGDPRTGKIIAYQSRFYAVVLCDPDAYKGRRTFVPDDYTSIEDVNSDPEARREFRLGLLEKERLETGKFGY